VQVNLLPVAFRRRILFRKRLRQWAPAWLIAAAAAASLAFSSQSSLDAQRAHLSRLEQQTEPLQTLVRENRQLRTRLDAIAGRQSLLAVLEPKLRPVQLLGLVSRCAREAGARVQIRTFALVPAPAKASTAPAPARRSAAQKPTAAPAAPPFRLDLAGVAADDLAIAEFVAALREQGAFRTVELRSSGDAPVELRRDARLEGRLREYTIECAFPGDGEL
jgi:hypothetical protein